MSEDQEPKVVSLDEARTALEQCFGKGVVVALEEKGAWVFDPAAAEIRHKDGGYYAVQMRNRGTYSHPVIHQEPGRSARADGIREIGQIIIDLASDGMVRTRATTGVDGKPDRELLASSNSKGEVKGEEGHHHFQTDPQRIDGDIGVHVVRVADKDGDGWMTPQEFVRVSRDGRSITALAKAGLL